MNTAQYLSKHQLADHFGIKVSYVEEKARTRAWPSLLIGGELRFGPKEIAEIERLCRRDARPKQPAATPAPAAQRTRTPAPGAAPNGVTRLRARPVRRRGA